MPRLIALTVLATLALAAPVAAAKKSRWSVHKATRTHEVPQPSGTETGSCTGARALGGGAVLDEDRSLLAPVTDAVGAGLVPFNLLSAPAAGR